MNIDPDWLDEWADMLDGLAAEARNLASMARGGMEEIPYSPSAGPIAVPVIEERITTMTAPDRPSNVFVLPLHTEQHAWAAIMRQMRDALIRCGSVGYRWSGSSEDEIHVITRTEQIDTLMYEGTRIDI